MAGPMAEMTGLDAVRGKMQWWSENHEIHDASVVGPCVNGEQFVVEFALDITFKPIGQRTASTVVGVYTVTDGKIVRKVLFPAVG